MILFKAFCAKCNRPRWAKSYTIQGAIRKVTAECASETCAPVLYNRSFQ